jgi:predicted amidophosphoribosyltransferase
VTVGDFEVTPPESSEPGCTTCRGKRLAWERTIRAGEYRGLLRRAIQETKFRASHALGLALGRELGQAVQLQMNWQKVTSHSLLIVPAPMSTLRRFRSGIDHAGAIARGVAGVTGGRIIRPLRRHHGPSQLEVPPSQRAKNAARAIEPRVGIPGFQFVHPTWQRLLAEPPPQGWVLLVVDDVKTTGATMTAACRALKGAITGAASPIKIRSTASTPRSSGSKSWPAPRIWTAVVGVTPAPSAAKEDREIPGDSLDLNL